MTHRMLLVVGLSTVWAACGPRDGNHPERIAGRTDERKANEDRGDEEERGRRIRAYLREAGIAYDREMWDYARAYLGLVRHEDPSNPDVPRLAEIVNADDRAFDADESHHHWRTRYPKLDGSDTRWTDAMAQALTRFPKSSAEQTGGSDEERERGDGIPGFVRLHGPR